MSRKNDETPLPSAEEGKMVCPNCDSGLVITAEVSRKFVYGVGSKAVELVAIVPVRHCEECGFEFLDEVAEEAEETAVREHLEVMTPRQLMALKKFLGLSVDGLGSLTRIGTASLRRWLRGTKVQNPALDDYLYLLGWQENVDRLKQRRNRRSSAIAGTSKATFRAINVEDHLEDSRSFNLQPRNV